MRTEPADSNPATGHVFRRGPNEPLSRPPVDGWLGTRKRYLANARRSRAVLGLLADTSRRTSGRSPRS